MFKFANRLVVIILGSFLRIFYNLGGGGKHRAEIKELLEDIKVKLSSARP